MLRYVIAVSAASIVMSGVALAQPVDTSVTAVYKSPHGTVVTKKHRNHRGLVVTNRKAVRHGYYGSSVSQSRTVTNPATGASRTVTRTIHGE